jgi:ATP-dependent Clp protease adaptor protein ClpS
MKQTSVSMPAQPSGAKLMSDLPVPVQPMPLQPLPEESEEPTRSHDILPLMEALFRVLVHNDDVTPFEYVMSILGKIFMLSEEIAEHVAITAHSEGLAVVIIRPRSEAERLSTLANRTARHDGFPLTFSVEPDV